MRLLLVLCILGLAGIALAKPGVFRERLAREFRNVKTGGHVSKHPINPLHLFRNQLSKSTKSATYQKKMDCELCPPPSDMKPCTCECECNRTKCSANIKCGSSLESASELQRVLSLSSYPVRSYERLLVENSVVDGPIDRHLLGSTVTFNEMNFNHNGFYSVESDAFNKTGSTLRKLTLNKNQIIYLGDWILEDTPNLQHLDFSENSLVFIPTDCLKSNHLLFLNASHNDIEDIGSSAFRGLSKITHLDLSHNALTAVRSNMLAFDNHKDVVLWVNLSHNQISSVKWNAISGVRKIILDLRYNKLGTLNEEVFRDYIDTTEANIHLDVTGNPIVCDCSLLWVVQNSTVANCFDDFPVCNSTIQYVTTDSLGDCTHNRTTLLK